MARGKSPTSLPGLRPGFRERLEGAAPVPLVSVKRGEASLRPRSTGCGAGASTVNPVLRQNPVRPPSRLRPAEPRRSGGLDPSPSGPFPFLQLGVQGGGQCPQLVKGHGRARRLPPAGARWTRVTGTGRALRDPPGPRAEGGGPEGLTGIDHCLGGFPDGPLGPPARPTRPRKARTRFTVDRPGATASRSENTRFEGKCHSLSVSRGTPFEERRRAPGAGAAG